MPRPCRTLDERAAVVLLSGGLDSAVALAAARRDGLTCHALTIDYGQRHRQELLSARRVAEHLGAASHTVVAVDLRALGGSALTDDIPVPRHRTDEQIAGGVPVTYVPARNLVFLSVATAHAECLGAAVIVLGVNAVDYSGYPDCRRAFLDAFERAANLGTRAGTEAPAGAPALRVLAPLVDLPKPGIIRLGHELGVDFSLTHSCYDPEPDGGACGSCDSCRIRRRGFEDAGLPDTTRYGRRAQPAARAQATVTPP